MARFRLDFELEGDAKGVHVRWRRHIGIPWADLGTFGTSPATFDVTDAAGKVQVNVRAVGPDRRPESPGLLLEADTKAPPDNREALADVTPPDPEVEQDGPVIRVRPAVPAGQRADEYDAEIRISDDNVTEPADALHVGFVRPGGRIDAPMCPGEATQRIHHRLVRREDGRATAFQTYDFETSRGSVEGTQGHSNGFASGTIVDLVSGFTPAEINGGDLRALGISLDDFDNVPGPGVALDDLASVALIDLGPLPTEFTYRTANVTLDAPEDLQFQVFPKLTSHGSIDFSLDAFGRFPLHWLEEQVASFVDQRLKNMGATLDGDKAPVVAEVKVATSASASPTFTANDYTAYRPGDVRKAVKTYAVETRFRLPFGGQVTVDEIDVRHWVFCKSRPWCHVSHAYELLHEEELAANAAQFGDVTLTAEDFDDLLIEVDWTTVAATITLNVWPNAGAVGAQVLSQASLGNGDRELLEVRVAPKTGDDRAFHVARNLQYDGTSWTAQAAAIEEWNDSATAITSLRFVSSNQPADGIAAGSRLRVYGKRHLHG